MPQPQYANDRFRDDYSLPTLSGIVNTYSAGGTVHVTKWASVFGNYAETWLPPAGELRINGERFLAYVKQFLVPTLKPGDIVILDNLGSHKGKAVRKAIRAVGARLVFLPKYSPDLNPIEQMFAKLKTLLRKAGERTVDHTWKRIGALLDHFPPTECANYLRNSGYASL